MFLLHLTALKFNVQHWKSGTTNLFNFGPKDTLIKTLHSGHTDELHCPPTALFDKLPVSNVKST